MPGSGAGGAGTAAVARSGGEAIEVGASFLLLDNMSIDDLRASVQVVAGRAELEATGGLTLDRARAVAATGVDYLSVGALTHSAPVLDIGVDLRPEHVSGQGEV